MSKRVLFKSRQRTIRAKDKPKRQTTVRLSDEAFTIVSRISNETGMSMKDVASEMILSVDCEVTEDDDDA